MKMYKRLCEYISKSGVINDVIIQYLIWKDKGKDKTYVVFRPGGGSSLSNTLANDYYVLVDFIGPDNSLEYLDNIVSLVVDYVTANQFDDCLGLVEVMSGIPAPVTTEDGRLVYRLQIAIKHGN